MVIRQTDRQPNEQPLIIVHAVIAVHVDVSVALKCYFIGASTTTQTLAPSGGLAGRAAADDKTVSLSSVSVYICR